MPGGDDSPRPASGASLGLGPASEVSNPSGFDVPAADRYEDAGLLGRGGMGEVRAARDRRLERTVAVKTAVRTDSNASKRLWKEAALTSGLTHPGIVPIHDAGRDRDGRAYYTMPVVQGRSLAEAANGASLDERQRLVRHFLDACRAVAYANAQGVLHRDLKPANILIGAFGETLVVDWGLAARVGEPAKAGDGAVVGTPAYMAPEQARGEPLAATADVYGLGATLHDMLTGKPPTGRPAREVEPQLPPELAAIVDRAVAYAPEDRYPDAQSLTEDVEAWFEGRQVAAHRYSAWELLRRFVQAWRIPIIAAGVAAAAILVVGVVGVQRTRAERDRARDAERNAVEARERAEVSLAQAQIAQALDAVARGDQSTAEVLATTALTTVESPAARGVLTHFDARYRPRSIAHWDLPPCRDLDLSDGGQVIACYDGSTVRVFRPGATLEELGSFALQTDALGVSSLGPTVLVREPDHIHTLRDVRGNVLLELGTTNPALMDDSADPTVLSYHTGGGLLRTDVKALRSWQDRTCNRIDPRVGGAPLPAARFNASAIANGGRSLVACNDLVLVRSTVDEAGEPVVLHVVDRTAGVLARVGISADGRIGAAVTTQGALVVVDMETGAELRSFPVDAELAGELAVSTDRVAVAGLHAVTVLDFRTGLRLVRIPSGEADIAWLDDGRHLRVAGDAVEDWELPPGAPRRMIRGHRVGVSTIAVSPDGTRVAAGDGDGVVRVIRLDGNEPEVQVGLDPSVVKDLAWSPDGSRVAVLCATAPFVFLVDAATGAVTDRIPSPTGRRVVWLGNGALVVATYAKGLAIFRPPDPTATMDATPGQSIDMEPDADGAGLSVLGSSGVGWRLHAGPTLELERLPVGGAGTLVASGGQVFASFGAEVRRVGGLKDGEGVLLPGALVVDMALSPDGRLLAVGQMDGQVRILETETLVERATLMGHEARLAMISFDPTGDWLVSGGWDGDVRVWSLVSLFRDARQLRTEAEATWRRTWKEALPSTAAASPAGATAPTDRSPSPSAPRTPR